MTSLITSTTPRLLSTLRLVFSSSSLLLMLVLLAAFDVNNISLHFAAAEVHAEGAPEQQRQDTCGAYRGASCDTIWHSQVLGEKGSVFAIKMSVAAALGMLIGIQREFGLAAISLPLIPSRVPRLAKYLSIFFLGLAWRRR